MLNDDIRDCLWVAAMFLIPTTIIIGGIWLFDLDQYRGKSVGLKIGPEHWTDKQIQLEILNELRKLNHERR